MRARLVGAAVKVLIAHGLGGECGVPNAWDSATPQGQALDALLAAVDENLPRLA